MKIHLQVNFQPIYKKGSTMEWDVAQVAEKVGIKLFAMSIPINKDNIDDLDKLESGLDKFLEGTIKIKSDVIVTSLNNV